VLLLDKIIVKLIWNGGLSWLKSNKKYKVRESGEVINLKFETNLSNNENVLQKVFYE